MVRSFFRPYALIAEDALCDTARKPCVRKAMQLSFNFSVLLCHGGAARNLEPIETMSLSSPDSGLRDARA